MVNVDIGLFYRVNNGFFLDTGGAHAAATTLMAFSRPTILKVVSARRDYEPGIRPIIKDLGFRWFFSYALIMVSIHHVSLFFIEVFKFSEMIYTLFRALLSISFTLILLIISQYLFVKRD